MPENIVDAVVLILGRLLQQFDELLDPQMWVVVLLLTLIGVISKLIIFSLGRRGKDVVEERVPNIKPEDWDNLEKRYSERGSKTLIFASIPGVGSALAAAAGVFGIQATTFIFWVALSTLIRNWLLVILFDQTLNILPI